MAIKAEGTQLAVISTEHTLLDTTDAGTYIFSINAENVVNGDKFTLRVYKKVKSTGTLQLVYNELYANIQSKPVIESIPTHSENQYKVTLEQTAGTGRNFDYEIDSL